MLCLFRYWPRVWSLSRIAWGPRAAGLRTRQPRSADCSGARPQPLGHSGASCWGSGSTGRWCSPWRTARTRYRLTADGDGGPAGTAAGNTAAGSLGGDPCSNRRWWASCSGDGDGGDGGAGWTVTSLLRLRLRHRRLRLHRRHRRLHHRHYRLTRLYHVRLADPAKEKDAFVTIS